MKISNKFIFALIIQITSVAFAMETKIKVESGKQSRSKSALMMSNATKKTSQNNENIEQRLLAAAQKEALDYLNAGTLKELDPTVGDWGCHERAPEVVRLYRQYKTSGAVPTESFEFLGLSRILTKAKKRIKQADLFSQINETTDPKRFTTELSRDKGDKFIEKCQSKITHLTVDIMQKQAKENGDAQLNKALSITMKDDERFKRLHVPFYPGFKTVMINALKNKIPIIFKVSRYDQQIMHRFYFFFKPTNDDYALAQLKDFDDSEALLVFEGTSSSSSNAEKTKGNSSQAGSKEFNELAMCSIHEFEERFKKLDIFELVLCNAAQHQQFVGKAHQATQIPFKEYGLEALQAEMQQKTKKAQHGFMRNALGGPYVFIIDHVFPSTIKEHKIERIIFESVKERLPSYKLCDLVLSCISIP